MQQYNMIKGQIQSTKTPLLQQNKTTAIQYSTLQYKKGQICCYKINKAMQLVNTLNFLRPHEEKHYFHKENIHSIDKRQNIRDYRATQYMPDTNLW